MRTVVYATLAMVGCNKALKIETPGKSLIGLLDIT